MTYSQTADNIKRIIQQRGLKQRAVAKRVGLTDNQFSALLNGRRVIKADDIIALARALEVTPNELLTKTAPSADFDDGAGTAERG